MSNYFDIVMGLAAWGMLAMPLVGTLLGLLAQLAPTPRLHRAPSAVSERQHRDTARASASPAPRSAGLRTVPGRPCVTRAADRVCVPA